LFHLTRWEQHGQDLYFAMYRQINRRATEMVMAKDFDDNEQEPENVEEKYVALGAYEKIAVGEALTHARESGYFIPSNALAGTHPPQVSAARWYGLMCENHTPIFEGGELQMTMRFESKPEKMNMATKICFIKACASAAEEKSCMIGTQWDEELCDSVLLRHNFTRKDLGIPDAKNLCGFDTHQCSSSDCYTYSPCRLPAIAQIKVKTVSGAGSHQHWLCAEHLEHMRQNHSEDLIEDVQGAAN
jgi:hypothetical protein